MSVACVSRLINKRLSEIDIEFNSLKESYPIYVGDNDRESVGETEGKLSGLRCEMNTIESIKLLLGL